jgi:hypothetical protein
VSSPAHDQTTVGERARSHDAEAVSEKFRATATTSPRKTSASDQVGSHKTLRWRGQSRANPSLKPKFPASRENAGNFIDSGLRGVSMVAKTRRQISNLRVNSLRIGTGNFLRPCRELNQAIREISALIRETAMTAKRLTGSGTRR